MKHGLKLGDMQDQLWNWSDIVGECHKHEQEATIWEWMVERRMLHRQRRRIFWIGGLGAAHNRLDARVRGHIEDEEDTS